MQDIKNQILQMYNEIKSKNKISNNIIQVGILNDYIINFLNQRNITIHSKEIYLTNKGLSHLSRDSKKDRGAGLELDDILKIPDILNKPYKVFLDTNKNKLNLLYCEKKISCDNLIKIVIDTKGITNRKNKYTLLKTAGYIKWYNIEKDKNYLEI